MEKTLLKFKLLLDLAAYVKISKPNAYVINTTTLTLLAYLTDVQLAIAIEEYSAAVVPVTALA